MDSTPRDPTTILAPLPRRLLAAAAICAAAGTAWLVAAPAAPAATFCVNVKPASCLLGTSRASLEDAIDDSSVNGQADTIVIGPSVTPHVGKFTSTADEKLTIIGAGTLDTVLEADPAVSTALALVGHPDSSVSNLTVRVKNVSGGRGLLLDGATARNVRIEYGGSEFDVHGATLRNATFEGGVVDMDAGIGFKVGPLSPNTSTIRDTRVHAREGVAVASAASATISRTRMITQGDTLSVGTTGAVTIDNSVLRRTGGPADCTLKVIGGTVLARHLTIVGPGVGSGVCAWTYGTAKANVTVESSIVHGHQLDLNRSGDATGVATFGVSYSSYASAYDNPAAGGALTQGAGNVDVAPAFVNAAFYDFHLDAPSSLFDAGNPNDAQTADFSGNPREVDADGVGGARSDIGAFEYQRQPPVAGSTVPASAQVGDTVTVSSAGSGDADPGDALTYEWDFGDGATTTGFTATHVYQDGGDHVVSLTVTDPTGLEATVAKTIAVAGPPAPPAPPAPAGQQPPTGTETAPPATPGSDTVAPVLTGVAVSPDKVRVGKAASVRLALSEPAMLTVTLQRLVPGRKAGSRCVKPAAAKRNARRCMRVAQVGGSIRSAAPGGAGSISVKGRLRGVRPGRYRVVVLAVDAAGNRSAARTMSFTVLAR